MSVVRKVEVRASDISIFRIFQLRLLWTRFLKKLTNHKEFYNVWQSIVINRCIYLLPIKLSSWSRLSVKRFYKKRFDSVFCKFRFIVYFNKNAICFTFNWFYFPTYLHKTKGLEFVKGKFECVFCSVRKSKEYDCVCI